jgi:hypothetical protein
VFPHCGQGVPKGFRMLFTWMPSADHRICRWGQGFPRGFRLALSAREGFRWFPYWSQGFPKGFLIGAKGFRRVSDGFLTGAKGSRRVSKGSLTGATNNKQSKRATRTTRPTSTTSHTSATGSSGLSAAVSGESKPAQWVFPCGKHAKKTFDHMLKVDPFYTQWIIRELIYAKWSGLREQLEKHKLLPVGEASDAFVVLPAV